MKLDKKAIESISINAVKNSIVTSRFLDQFISENDKEPSWDGAVYIYEKPHKIKENLKGRMPVQVKGKICDDHSKDEITYSMSKTDLRNYLNDGGCILFVVYIGNLGLTNKIYYVELTPVKLRNYLKNSKGKKTKTLDLKTFPNDENQKTTIFMNCLQNCRKQSSFAEGKLYSLNELASQGFLEKLFIPVSGVGMKDPQRALIDNEVYIYAKIKGSDILHPIESIPTNIHTKQENNAKITINEKVYYTKYYVIKNAESTILCIGNSMKMSIKNKESIYKIDYKNSKKCRTLAKDLDFILKYLEVGYFYIDDVKIPFGYDGMKTSGFDIEKEKQNLFFLKKIVELLDILNCEEDIDIDEMKEVDWKNLEYLIDAFVDNKSIKGLNDDLPPIMSIPVGKLRFAVVLKKLNSLGEYQFFDFFKTEFHFIHEDLNGHKNEVSRFMIMKSDDFINTNNIDFDILFPSFKKIPLNMQTYNCANQFLLELLLAFDKSNANIKNKIINVCLQFSEWIFDSPDESLQYQIKLLNKLQVIKRIREFTLDEKIKLYELIENEKTNEEYLVGAYLLLDDQVAAQMHFNKLPKEQQEVFKNYPIYSFYKE